MSDAVPDTLSAAPPPDRRIVATAAVSIAVHALLIGFILLPRLHPPEAAEPPAVNVDLVPASRLVSLPPVPSSEPVSSEMPSSETSSSAEASSAEPASSTAPSSVEASSAEPSSAEASSAVSSAAASEQPASSEQPSASSQEIPKAAKPIVIPVGPSEPSSEETSSVENDSSASEAAPSSAASEESSADMSSVASEEASAPSALTAEGGAADGAADADAAPGGTADTAPAIKGALHVAKRFYLKALLDAPAMARAKAAIKQLPPEKRLVQTCNIEAVGQLGNAGRGFNPDAVIADALSRPASAGTTFTVTGGAFRSGGKWRGLAYTCTLSGDMSAVKSFTYRVGDDVTALLKSRIGG